MSSGKVSTICWAVHAAVGCSVTLKCRTRRRWWARTDQNEEHTQLNGGHGEEVDRDQVLDMVGQERAPGLRRRWAPLGDHPGDGALGHVNPELEELPMDSGGAPQRIGGGHFSGEGDDFGVNRRTAEGGPAGELGPVLTETTPLPTQDRVGSHEHEGLPPPGPDPGQRRYSETQSREREEAPDDREHDREARKTREERNREHERKALGGQPERRAPRGRAWANARVAASGARRRSVGRSVSGGIDLASAKSRGDRRSCTHAPAPPGTEPIGARRTSRRERRKPSNPRESRSR